MAFAPLGRTVIRVDLASSRLFPAYPRQPTWRQVLRLVDEGIRPQAAFQI